MSVRELFTVCPGGVRDLAAECACRDGLDSAGIGDAPRELRRRTERPASASRTPEPKARLRRCGVVLADRELDVCGGSRGRASGVVRGARDALVGAASDDDPCDDDRRDLRRDPPAEDDRATRRHRRSSRRPQPGRRASGRGRRALVPPSSARSSAASGTSTSAFSARRCARWLCARLWHSAHARRCARSARRSPSESRPSSCLLIASAASWQRELLLELLPQRAARAEEQRLERGDADAEHVGDLGVRAAFELAHDERGALVRRQLRERAPQVLGRRRRRRPRRPRRRRRRRRTRPRAGGAAPGGTAGGRRCARSRSASSAACRAASPA